MLKNTKLRSTTRSKKTSSTKFNKKTHKARKFSTQTTSSKSPHKDEESTESEDASQWSQYTDLPTPAGLPGDRPQDPMVSRNMGHFDPNNRQIHQQHAKKPRRFDNDEDEELYDRILERDNLLKAKYIKQHKAQRKADQLQKKIKSLNIPPGEENSEASLKLIQAIELTDSEKGSETEWEMMDAPDFDDFVRARKTFDLLQPNDTVDFSGKDDRFHGILDPFNPPNLTYQHVKLLKNIDYSPLVKRAAEGGQFTVEDVITILQDEGVTDQFKSVMRREHQQDPVVYSRTFDVFNKGRKPCPLCLPDPTINQINRIHYTNINLLRKYVSTTGMILPRKVSGVCVSHQKKLRYAIKNAKQLALMSYTSNWHVPLSYVDPEKFPSYEDQNTAANVERERRLEIKGIFDNLVADKQAQLAGRDVTSGMGDERQPQDEAGAEGVDDESKQTPQQLIQDAAAHKIRESKKKLDMLLERTTDEKEIAQLYSNHEQEVKNINYDMNKDLESAGDNSQDSLRADFGELLDLDTFDVNMSFDEFIHKYNVRMKSMDIKPMEHGQILIRDSDNEQITPQKLYRQNRDIEF